MCRAQISVVYSPVTILKFARINTKTEKSEHTRLPNIPKKPTWPRNCCGTMAYAQLEIF